MDIKLTNESEVDIENWEVEFPFGDKIENIWNAQITKKINTLAQ